MSPELSTSCQAHTESLTIIPCSLGHHTEHPKWLKLVGIVQRWGRLLVMSHRALTSWLKRGTLSHSRFPSKTVPVVPGHHTEHARLVSLKERITPSLNSFSFRLSQFQIIISLCASKLPLQLLLYHTNPKLLIQLLLAVTNTPFNYSTLSVLFQHLPLTSDTLGDHCDRNLER